MPPQQDDIRIEQADDNKQNPVVVVNGKEVVVSSATEKPNRSLWVAWLYIFDVRYIAVAPGFFNTLTLLAVVPEPLLS
jgi:hypothetical protein